MFYSTPLIHSETEFHHGRIEFPLQKPLSFEIKFEDIIEKSLSSPSGKNN